MPGPAPKAAPVRRNARIGPVLLPAEGRKGPLPEWPLPGRQLKTEKELWAQLWSTPQSVAWEKLGGGTVRVVARYVRYAVMAELGNDKAAAEVRQLEDKLGLTPKSMRALLWMVAEDELAEKRADAAPAAEDVRRRIRAVG